MGTLIRSKHFEILIVFLILIYTALVFITLMLDETIEESKNAILIVQIIELVLLAIFTIEIILNIYVFRSAYFDKWNVFDIIVIAISFGFVITEMTMRSKNVGTFFKIRGLFRLLRILRISILMRKVNK